LEDVLVLGGGTADLHVTSVRKRGGDRVQSIGVGSGAAVGSRLISRWGDVSLFESRVAEG
jgi:tRNA A58 N-methylase Trm61